MPLIETLTIEVGSAVAKSIFKAWLKEYDLASDASASIVDVLKSWTTDNITRRRAQRQLEEIGEKVGESLLPIFEKEGASLDEASRTAIAFAVAETLNTASSEVLAQHDLDPSKLASYLLAHPVAAQYFNETEQLLYQSIISRSCHYIVAIASGLPTFTEHTFAEVLKRESQLLKIAEQTLRAVNDERGQKRFERERRLQAMLIDYRGFINARLESFVGREQELAEVHQRIDALLPTGGYLLITGQAGQGKSSIIAKLADEYGQENVANHFIPFNPGPDHQVGLMRSLMARLILKYDLPDLYVASESRPALRDYFPHVLSDVSKKGDREVIFLDGLDQLEEDATGIRDLTFLPTNPPPGIVFVLGTRPNDALKPLELLKPFDDYRLPNLNRGDFDRILQHRHVILEQPLADRFYEAMQENALYLDLVAQELAKAAEIRPEEIIERVATNPENLFSLSINRLKRQRIEWREVIKPILGILLAAREPFSFAHIRQILRLDADQLKEGLERLGGLVSSDGSGRYALFHLKFYDYMRQDGRRPQKDYLFASDEEENWHQTLADWCEGGNLQLIWEDTPYNHVEQERRVYARRHFITHLFFAQNFSRLFAVLDAHSFGQMKVRFDPSTRSYAEDLNLGRKAAAGEHWSIDEGISLLPRLWRYTLLQCSIASRADRYPEAAFVLLVLLGREQEALGLAELLTDRANKAHILITIAKTCKQQQKGEESRKQEESYINLLMRTYEVASVIEDRYKRARTLCDLGIALAQAQHWNEAERVIATIEESDNRAIALSQLGAELAQAQKREQAQTVWAEAERVIGTIASSLWRANALSQLGTALAQAQERERAEIVWTEAERVIGTIEKSDERARALTQLGTALEKAHERELAQTVWVEAERVIGTIEDPFYHPFTLIELGTALAQAQKREQALTVWVEAERVISTIHNSVGDYHTYKLGVALAEVQQWAAANRVIATIEKSDERAKALSGLGVALAQAQRWAEAEQVIATIEKSDEHAKALSGLGVALAQAQKREQALTVWAEAKRMIGTSEAPTYHAKALIELGTALAQVREREQALMVWAEGERVITSISSGYYHDKALSKLGAALVQAQQWTEAERAIATIRDGNERTKTLSKLGAALVQAQQWTEAERAIATIEKSDDRATALSGLGVALVQAQQWTAAERVFATIEKSDDGAYALSKLGTALAQAQERQQALTVLAKAGRMLFRLPMNSRALAYALIELGTALVQTQERQLAQTMWAEAERVIGTIEKSYERAKALIELGTALVQAQERQLAQTVWVKAEQLITAIESSYSRSFALSKLGTAFVQAQQWAEAERVIGTIEESDDRRFCLMDLGVALAQAQQWAEAERVITTIDDPGYRTRALSSLGEVLAQTQQWTEAERILSIIDVSDFRSSLLHALGVALAQAQQWAEAERMISTIGDSSYRADALCALGVALFQANKLTQLLRLVQRSWFQADTRDYALEILSLANEFIPFNPAIGIEFFESFSWVDDFLKG